MTPTPHLDRATIARILTDDFPLEQRDIDELYDPVARDQLEEAVREVVGGFEGVAARALDVWRERRGIR
jgi:hypothetical protein